MIMNKDIVIVNGVRTPFGHMGGFLRDISTEDQAVMVAKEAMNRSNVAPDMIDHIIFGNANQTSADAHYLARHIGLRAGLPIEIPALALGRICGSGMEAIVSGARMILLDEADFILAGGTESMSRLPFVVPNARWGISFGKAKLEDWLFMNFLDTYNNLTMPLTAEKLIEKYQIPREEQDKFAVRSHQLAAQARDAGRLPEEIMPLEKKDRKGNIKIYKDDEHIRDDSTYEALAKLRPAFKQDGTITAGNACPISDGAAAAVLTTAEKAKEHNLKPLGRMVSWGTAGVDPDIMGIGPVPASRMALQRAGLKLEDIDLIEVNEAFAGQYLSVEKELGLDRDKVNVNGGAIAIGHPTAATGTRLTLTILYELRRRNKRYGLATMCIGGGQGMAAIVESLQ